MGPLKVYITNPCVIFYAFALFLHALFMHLINRRWRDEKISTFCRQHLLFIPLCAFIGSTDGSSKFLENVGNFLSKVSTFITQNRIIYLSFWSCTDQVTTPRRIVGILLGLHLLSEDPPSLFLICTTDCYVTVRQEKKTRVRKFLVRRALYALTPAHPLARLNLNWRVQRTQGARASQVSVVCRCLCVLAADNKQSGGLCHPEGRRGARRGQVRQGAVFLLFLLFFSSRGTSSVL